MSESIETPTESAPESPAGDIVARPQFWHRFKQSIFAIVLIGFGLWSIRDGFFKWPADKARANELRELRAAADRDRDQTRVTQLTEEITKISEHTEMSTWFNKVIGIIAPPLGLFMLIRTFWTTRGRLRLSDGVLSIPGHPPIPLARLTELDQKKWDKKGIAFVKYELEDGRKGRFRLDDVWYERPPTDAIYDQVKAQFPSEAGEEKNAGSEA